MNQFLLIIAGIVFWAAAWGVFRPYKGLSPNQFAGIALAAIIVGGIVAPRSTDATAAASSSASPQDFMTVLALLVLLAGIWGMVRPYRGFRRSHFAVLSAAAFITVLAVVPEPSPDQNAALASKEAGKAAKETADQQGLIIAKAKEAIDGSVPYTKDDFEDTYATIGPKMFGRLNELERGAFLVAAESSQCDKVAMGAVSLTASRKNAPKWYVDCDNGNRFMVNAEQADAAIDREKAKALKETALESSCTSSTIKMCNASSAQKSVSETEVVTFCDLTTKEALISEPNFKWSWQYGFAGGDKVRVAREFTAQNAFGANLKSRYICEFDAASKTITSLVIENGLGSQKVI